MKKNIRSIIVLVFSLGVAFLGWKSYQTLNRKEKVKEATQRLPELNFQYVRRGNDVDNRSVIVNLFSPDCEHCQYMAKQIGSNRAAFSATAVVMITKASEVVTKKFNEAYKLNELPFLSIAIDTADDFYKTFATNIVPCFFIYNKEHKLVKLIKGETKIENLIEAIK